MSAKEKQPNVECNHSAYNHAASAAAKSASLPTHALALHKHNYKHNNGVIVHAWHDLVVTRLEGYRCNAHSFVNWFRSFVNLVVLETHSVTSGQMLFAR